MTIPIKYIEYQTMIDSYYSYQDVFLMPRYSKFSSRDEANTSVTFGPRTFKLPVIPANMECVIDTKIAKWLSENDYFYIMHRFNKNKNDKPNTDNWGFVVQANQENWKTISISVGVQEHDLKFLETCMLCGYRIDYLTLDIAHAHSIRMKEMLGNIRRMYQTGLPPNSCFNERRSNPFIIAGNVATKEAVKDLTDWGADAIKVGIAQGGACTTFGMTGFGEPMFSCMLKCSEEARVPLIADGGIKTNGDFAKAIRAGGTMVMAGSVFAACKDAPGENICGTYLDKQNNWTTDNSNILRKIYYGSASSYNKGSNRHVEGTKLELPCNGMTYAEKYQEITDSYSSSISYAGGKIKTCRWGIRSQ